MERLCGMLTTVLLLLVNHLTENFQGEGGRERFLAIRLQNNVVSIATEYQIVFETRSIEYQL